MHIHLLHQSLHRCSGKGVCRQICTKSIHSRCLAGVSTIFPSFVGITNAFLALTRVCLEKIRARVAHLVLGVHGLSPLLVLVSILLSVLDHAVHLVTCQGGRACDLDVLLLPGALVCTQQKPGFKFASGEQPTNRKGML